jgi:phosphoenolpyruvate carboxykinase (ATP)
MLDEDHDVDYTDVSITQNTRRAYPIEFIKSAKIPAPRDIQPT